MDDDAVDSVHNLGLDYIFFSRQNGKKFQESSEPARLFLAGFHHGTYVKVQAAGGELTWNLGIGEMTPEAISEMMT